MYAYVCSYVYGYTCVVGPKLMPSVFLNLSLPYVLRQDLLLNLELSYLASLAILLAWEIS